MEMPAGLQHDKSDKTSLNYRLTLVTKMQQHMRTNELRLLCDVHINMAWFHFL